MKTFINLLFLVLTVSVVYAQVPTTNLVAYYPFDGNANDAAGTLHGTVNGATLTADRFGNDNQAYAFNGSNNSIEFSGPPITVTDKWTISVWVKPASLNQAGMMLSVGYDNAFSYGDGYAIGFGNGDTNPFGYGPGNQLMGAFGGVAFIATPYSFTSTDSWYQVVMRRASGITSFFVNGTLVSQYNSFAPVTPTDFTIGSVSGARFFNGSLDEVRIYDRDLTDTEVQQLYLPVCTTSLTLTASNPISCTATSATLTATGWTADLIYAYTGPSGALPQSTSAIVVSESGLYSVTATAPNGCSATASVTVNGDAIAAQATISPTAVTLSCASPSVSLTASGGVTGETLSYRWEDNSTIAIRTISSAGVYSVTVTAPNGCTATASVIVSGDNSIPTATISPASATLTCSNKTVKLVASGGVSYRWDKGTSPTRNVNAAGIYSVTVTAANGCTATASATVVSAIVGKCKGNARMGAEEPEGDIQITVAPNPVIGGFLRATISGAGGQPLTVQLIDMRGQPVRQQQWEQAAEHQVLEWDIQAQPAGLYFLRASTNRQQQTTKVVKH